jgi:hypothetical protein
VGNPHKNSPLYNSLELFNIFLRKKETTLGQNEECKASRTVKKEEQKISNRNPMVD